MAPQSADLDDPLGYVERFGTTTSDEMDDELARLLDGARSEDDGRSGDENNGDENNGDETRGA